MQRMRPSRQQKGQQKQVQDQEVQQEVNLEQAQATVHGDFVPGTSADDPSNRMRNESPIKVKQLKKGITAESDLILQLWEEGIQDALDKNYLSSLILGIYLNEDDDNDIVEAYTFNFSYDEIEGTGRKMPLLNLTESMQSVNIFDQASTASGANGIAGQDGNAALPAPQVRTVIDVRRQIRLLLRALITMSQSFQDLPLPLDYEPPGFILGQPQERLLFSTASIADRPDQMSIGSIATGFHGMSLHLATLAPYLRRASEENGMTLFDLRRADEALQAQDAAERKVLWDAEEPAHMHRESLTGGDVAGEPDLGLNEAERRKRDEQRELNKRLGLDTTTVSEPVGVRLPDGKVAPVPPTAVRQAEDRQEKRARGEPVSDDEDLTEPVTFVVKHLKHEAITTLTPQTTNAIIAASAASPSGTGAPTTATGSSRLTGNSQSHLRAPLDLTSEGMAQQRKNTDHSLDDGAGSKTPIPSSSAAAPSSPLADRARSVWAQAEDKEAATDQADKDSVPMDVDDFGPGAEDDSAGAKLIDAGGGATDDFMAESDFQSAVTDPVLSDGIQPSSPDQEVPADAVGDSLATATEFSLILDPDETRVEEESQLHDSIKSFTQTQKEGESIDHDSIQDSQAPALPGKGSQGDDIRSASQESSQRSLRARKSASNKKNAQIEGESNRGSQDMEVDLPANAEKADCETMGCACDDPEDSGLSMQCDECRKWVHAACYGYRVEKLMPATFACYACRFARADVLTEDEKTKMLAELGSLALTRHALDVLHTDGWPGDINRFATAIGASLANARNILKVVEQEGYIRRGEETGPGTAKTTLGRSKAKTSAIAAKSITIYKNNAIKGKLKKRYFTPGGGIEKEILAPWLEKTSAGDGVKDSPDASREEDIRDESQRDSQKAEEQSVRAGAEEPTTSTKAPGTPLAERSNIGATSSSQTAVGRTSTPNRPGSIPPKQLQSARMGTRSSPRSASKRKTTDNHDEKEDAELMKKRRAKTSRPAKRIALGDF
ncbi:hypothetical protein A4X09_0g360 [Tilletia walkeri]|uniref:HORMA domain-containing protein n=1 Tax=Tilletia walkeri TaxID=117179 RepID=A0A8X7NHH8_9BASI|nr:hypothetical protein A4X09_0g360 [Tilletia walkeri]